MAKAVRAVPSAEPRVPLSRERVLRAAVELADESGIESLTMRSLGQKLGVEAMSLYNHVANKEDILDGMVDVVMSEINDAVSELDPPSGDWKTAMRRRVLAAREILLRHRWAPGVLESRKNESAPMMRYYDSLIGLFQEGGFSNDLTHHALHALGSRALGFTQELYDDSQASSRHGDRCPADRRRVPEHRRDADGGHPRRRYHAGLVRRPVRVRVRPRSAARRPRAASERGLTRATRARR